MIYTGTFKNFNIKSNSYHNTDAEDVINEEYTVSYSVALKPVETLLHYRKKGGFDYHDITVVCKTYVSLFGK